MSEEQNNSVDQLAQQLSAISQQLQEISQRFDKVDDCLNELSDVPAKISQIERDLMLFGDRHRYKALQQYLAEENWFEADHETVRVILAITGKKIEELKPRDIEDFPCKDLLVIDQLWCTYSNDRFGFTPQLRTYKAVGGDIGSTIASNNQKLREAWGEELGWRKDKTWLKCKDLDFSLNAPFGCHPSR